MVVIRLSRGGAKKRPYYHIVVANKAAARNGRFIEEIGYYNPLASGKEKGLSLNAERLAHWIKCGAQASDRVKFLIKAHEKAASKPAEAASK